MVIFVRCRRPPASTRTCTLVPYATLFRALADAAVPGRAARSRGSPGLPAGAARPARRPGGQSAASGELPDPANRTAGDAMNPLDRLSSFYYRIPGLSWLSRLSKPGLRRALAVVVAIVLLLLLLWIAIGVLPLLPLRFWQLAGLDRKSTRLNSSH